MATTYFVTTLVVLLALAACTGQARRAPKRDSDHESLKCGVNWKSGKTHKRGHDSTESHRVVKGQRAPVGMYPWAANLWSSNFVKGPGNETPYTCTGVLIDELHVLTAAHCLYLWRDSEDRQSVGENCEEHLQNERFFAQDIAVHYGKSDILTRLGGVQMVEKAFLHKKFPCHGNNESDIVDIGILRVKQPVKFHLAHDSTEEGSVNRICLPEEDATYSDGIAAEVAGWGWTNPSEASVSDNLKVAHVVMTNHESCHKKFPDLKKFEVCTGIESGDGNPCFGDSGGPLMKQSKNGIYELIGLVSRGLVNGCKTPQTGFTQISKVLDFIRDVQANRSRDDIFSFKPKYAFKFSPKEPNSGEDYGDKEEDEWDKENDCDKDDDYDGDDAFCDKDDDNDGYF